MNDAARPRTVPRSTAGFTLVEMMVVVALVGILAGISVAYQGEPRANARGFAEQLVGEADATRLRALSSRRWHRIRIDTEARQLVIEQANEAGMIVPKDDEDWSTLSVSKFPLQVEVVAVATTANYEAGVGVPAEGDGLDEALLFGPDGAGEPRTLYLRNTSGKNPFRVVVYRATGTAYAKEGW